MRRRLPFLAALALAAICAAPAAAQTADLSVSKTDSPDPVVAGMKVTYTITVTNAGPDDAASVSLSDTLPAGTLFNSLSSPGGWSCTTPPVGSGGTVSCSIATLPMGSAVFTLTVLVDAGVAAGTVLSNTADVTTTTSDPDPNNNSATETTTVAAAADLQVSKLDSFDPLSAGATQTYTITVTNNGPADAEFVNLDDTLPAGTTFLSLSSPGGWTCTTPAVGSGGDVNCSIDLLAAFTTSTFTLQVVFDADLQDGTVVTNTATVSAETPPEGNPGDESGSASTTIGTPTDADVTVTKTGTPDPVFPGDNLTYTITVINNGPADAATVTLDDTLPDGTTFQSLASPGGWSCTTPAVGATGDVNCSIATLAPGSAVFTLVVQADATATPNTFISNTAIVSSPTNDPNPENGVASSINRVASPPVVTATKTVSGQFQPGGAIAYTIILTNSGDADQTDNPGDELTDVLPAELTLVSASATSGAAVATVATNTVT